MPVDDDKENIDESEVEEIIKQHLMEEKKKTPKSLEKEESIEDEVDKKSSEDSDGYDYMDDSLNMNAKSPK